VHSRQAIKPSHRKHWAASASSIATQYPASVKIYGCVQASCGFAVGTSMTISFQDMIAELRRELRHRKIIYPSLIKRGALTGTAADRQNARLQGALDLLVSLDDIERPQTSDA
jgi:hypothetical protein